MKTLSASFTAGF